LRKIISRGFTPRILRSPNPHVSFGGTGAHYCMGANLARMTVNLMFGALADAMPDLSALAPPERLRSGWLNGIKHWQVDYSGSAIAGRRRDGVKQFFEIGACPSGAVSYLGHLDHVDVDSRRRDLLQLFGISS
jgi:hypothetical protein